MLDTITIFDNDDESALKKQTHRITDIKEAVRDKNRINIYIDDKFFCSLDIAQVVDYGVKINRELNDKELAELKRASDFGKFYTQTLEFVLLHPHSTKEIRDYLKRKTLSKKIRIKDRKTNEYVVKKREGFDSSLIPLVLKRLGEHGYLDDEYFARFWVNNRNMKKGISSKKLRHELAAKGVDAQIIETVLQETDRNDRAELKKIITRKAYRYDDQQKLIQYLVRQGFSYADVLEELSTFSSDGA